MGIPLRLCADVRLLASGLERRPAKMVASRFLPNQTNPYPMKDKPDYIPFAEIRPFLWTRNGKTRQELNTAFLRLLGLPESWHPFFVIARWGYNDEWINLIPSAAVPDFNRMQALRHNEGKRVKRKETKAGKVMDRALLRSRLFEAVKQGRYLSCKAKRDHARRLELAKEKEKAEARLGDIPPGVRCYFLPAEGVYSIAAKASPEKTQLILSILRS